MPLEQVSEVRSRLVTSRSGKTYRVRFADYECPHCGKTSEKQVSNARRDGSCGCQRGRLVAELKTKHGMIGTPTYASWKAMIQRCTNPQCPHFERYGGRGIAVCDRWLAFEAFLEDMGERPVGRSLDRINNSQDYEPGNCRWADTKTQNRNTRSNRILTIDGTSRCLSEWAEQPEAAQSRTIYWRLWAGWSDREAVFGKNRRNGEAKDASQS